LESVIKLQDFICPNINAYKNLLELLQSLSHILYIITLSDFTQLAVGTAFGVVAVIDLATAQVRLIK
jgi:ABC-type methionine transport system permease subunit